MKLLEMNLSIMNERTNQSLVSGMQAQRCFVVYLWGQPLLSILNSVLNLIEGATRKMTDASLPNLRHQLSCERSLQ